MGRANDLAAAAADYVPVRVTNLQDLDVANLRFDFDLTFAVLLIGFIVSPFLPDTNATMFASAIALIVLAIAFTWPAVRR